MPLKTDLSDMSISSVRASIAKVNVTLKAWNETDNSTTDPPVLQKVITENNVKIYVEGQTPEELAERIKKDIKSQAQEKIHYYQTEQGHINNVTSAFQSMINDVDDQLISSVKAKV